MTRDDAGRGAVIRQALSLSVATGLYGISFGALAVTAGCTLPQTMALSLLMFSGSAQFAFVGVVGAGGLPVTAIASAGLLGIRNALYGVQLGPQLALAGWRRVVGAHLTIDESTAVSTTQTTPELRRFGFWWAGIGVFCCWNALTLCGAIIGNAIGDPRSWGLDAAAAGAFLGLLWPRLASRPAQACAALAAVIAACLVPFAPAGVPVLGAACAAIVVGLWSQRRPASDTGGPPAVPPEGAITLPEVGGRP